MWLCIIQRRSTKAQEGLQLLAQKRRQKAILEPSRMKRDRDSLLESETPFRGSVVSAGGEIALPCREMQWRAVSKGAMPL